MGRQGGCGSGGGGWSTPQSKKAAGPARCAIHQSPQPPQPPPARRYNFYANELVVHDHNSTWLGVHPCHQFLNAVVFREPQPRTASHLQVGRARGPALRRVHTCGRACGRGHRRMNVHALWRHLVGWSREAVRLHAAHGEKCGIGIGTARTGLAACSRPQAHAQAALGVPGPPVHTHARARLRAHAHAAAAGALPCGSGGHLWALLLEGGDAHPTPPHPTPHRQRAHPPTHTTTVKRPPLLPRPTHYPTPHACRPCRCPRPRLLVGPARSTALLSFQCPVAPPHPNPPPPAPPRNSRPLMVVVVVCRTSSGSTCAGSTRRSGTTLTRRARSSGAAWPCPSWTTT